MSINDYIHNLFVHEDEALKRIPETLEQNDMPKISVPGETGKLLTLLVKLTGAKNVLEVGSLGGYSSIWLARGLPEKGKLTSLELEEKHARVARENVAHAGLDDKVTYVTGDAIETFSDLVSEGETYDFFFIDADKGNYIPYLEAALLCAEPGAIIAADNVLWGGRVADAENNEEDTEHIRRYNEFVAGDDRLESMLIPIGDGLLVSRVKE
ncbi:methyltransferase [Alteribacter lacisalsi]|uniref:Methyltransferase n=1 Tax=Alteribacter lacisalsi TaxID=2045244 RepID=A0A2W0HIY4_9BACI|nr:O-methyltransferase [Alteribacter lacisalsi]PYZ97455.1 methyltransferase [Alteribacter lacisalsi]